MPPLTFSDQPVAERQFSYTARNSIVFTSHRCDFRGGVTIQAFRGVTKEDIAAGVAEMIGYHATNVLEQLYTGFQGYDCIQFTIKEY